MNFFCLVFEINSSGQDYCGTRLNLYISAPSQKVLRFRLADTLLVLVFAPAYSCKLFGKIIEISRLEQVVISPELHTLHCASR